MANYACRHAIHSSQVARVRANKELTQIKSPRPHTKFSMKDAQYAHCAVQRTSIGVLDQRVRTYAGTHTTSRSTMIPSKASYQRQKTTLYFSELDPRDLIGACKDTQGLTSTPRARKIFFTSPIGPICKSALHPRYLIGANAVRPVCCISEFLSFARLSILGTMMGVLCQREGSQPNFGSHSSGFHGSHSQGCM